MNERIEQLAEQAGMIIDKYGLARDAQTGLEDGVDIYKFAELIVQECQTVVEWAISVDSTIDRVPVLIQEHFGV